MLERGCKGNSNLLQANLDLRNSIFPFLTPEWFDLRKIYVLNLKTCQQKKKNALCRSFLNPEFTVLIFQPISVHTVNFTDTELYCLGIIATGFPSNTLVCLQRASCHKQ